MQVENVSALLDSVVGAGDGVAHGSLVLEDFIVVAAGHRAIAEEVDLGLLRVEVLQAEPLVPASDEAVNTDLPADGELKVESLAEEFLENRHHRGADFMFLVELVERQTFLERAVSTNG